MIRVGLIGGRGYVGEELLRLFDTSDTYRCVYAGSGSFAGRAVGDVFDGLQLDGLSFSSLEAKAIAQTRADAWIIAQPNGQAEKFLPLFGADDKIIDISSDFRFDDRWVYGLPERYATKISRTSRVANPGCYATAGQLGLLPLVDTLTGPPQIFGVSGYSGAGRKPNDKNDPQRLRDNLIPYSLNDHTHEREISLQLDRPVQFMPHVAAFFRGISLTITCQLNRSTDHDELLSKYQAFYANDDLVEITGGIPEIQSVANSNKCTIGGFVVDKRDSSRLILVSVIDNLRKGAASQAVQNLNLMFGMESTKGLLQ